MADEKRITDTRNDRTRDLDSLSTFDILKKMNEEDKLVAEAVEKEIKAIELAAEAVIEAIKNNGRIFYVGAGTSGRLGVMDAIDISQFYGIGRQIFIPIIAGGEDALKCSVPGAQDDKHSCVSFLRSYNFGPGDIVIGITSSGSTPFVVGALEYARKTGARTVCITNTVESEVSQKSDLPISVIVGPEAVTGSTRLKSATSVKMVLNMISTTAVVKSGQVFENMLLELEPSNSKRTERRRNAVMEITGLSQDAADFLITESGGSTKTAIVMALGGVARGEAEEVLSLCGGMVRKALEMLKIRNDNKTDNGRD